MPQKTSSLGRLLALALCLPLALPCPAAAAAGPAYPVDPDAGAGSGPLQGEGSALTGPQRPNEPPELAPPPDPEVARALSLSMMRRDLEAARIFESLWQSTGDIRLLYQAALARSRAGQHSAALRHLALLRQRAGALADATLGHLDALEAAERALTAKIRLRLIEGPPGSTEPLLPSDVEAATITLEGPLQDGERTTFDLRGIRDDLYLDPGPWTIRVTIPGFLPLELRRQAVQGEDVWELNLERQRILVEVHLRPERALRGAKMTISRTDGRGRPVLREGLQDVTSVVLTPGPWSVEVKGPRYQGTTYVTVTPATRKVDLVLTRKGPQGERLNKDKKLAFALTGLLGVGYITGVGLLLGGVSRENRAKEDYDALLEEAGADLSSDAPIDPAIIAEVEPRYPSADYNHDQRVAAMLQTSGVITAMGGAATAFSALPTLVGARRRSLYIVGGVGGAIFGGGVGWLVVYMRRQDAILGPGAPHVSDDDLSKLVGHRLGAGMLTGIGGGLLVGTAITAIVDLRRRRRSYALGPALGPGLVGLQVSGRF